MAKTPKGFICLGNGDILNTSFIKSINLVKDKAIVIDTYGVKHVIDKKLVKKLEVS